MIIIYLIWKFDDMILTIIISFLLTYWNIDACDEQDCDYKLYHGLFSTMTSINVYMIIYMLTHILFNVSMGAIAILILQVFSGLTGFYLQSYIHGEEIKLDNIVNSFCQFYTKTLHPLMGGEYIII